MAIIKCPECGKEISDSVKRCPNCAYKLKRTNKRKIVIIVAILVVVSIVAGLGYVYIKNNTCILGHDWKKQLVKNLNNVLDVRKNLVNL